MKNSKIGWTHHTWNPWWGCHKVSEGCRFCYIGKVMRRSGNEPFHGPMRTSEATWKNPLTWDRHAAAANERYRVFTCSMSDFFHPDADEWRPEAWEVIHRCEHLDWLILTKRPELIRERLPDNWGSNGYKNVWLGVTVELQKNLDRIDVLAENPAALRFVSAEPLLGLVRFGTRISKLDWIITGCEQAHRDRRQVMEDSWVASIRDECARANVPLFHKQYYIGNQIQTDGLIEGDRCQQWPLSVV